MHHSDVGSSGCGDDDFAAWLQEAPAPSAQAATLTVEATAVGTGARDVLTIPVFVSNVKSSDAGSGSNSASLSADAGDGISVKSFSAGADSVSKVESASLSADGVSNIESSLPDAAIGNISKVESISPDAWGAMESADNDADLLNAVSVKIEAPAAPWAVAAAAQIPPAPLLNMDSSSDEEG
jgi:hypothetical protein